MVVVGAIQEVQVSYLFLFFASFSFEMYVSGRGSSSYGHSSGKCGTTCIWIIVGLTLGISLPIIYCCCCIKTDTGPLQDNLTFVNSGERVEGTQEVLNDAKMFQSGVWFSRYYQNGEMHGPHEISLSFDPETKEIKGSGKDDVGIYGAEGTFSKEAYRIGLTKCYELGTGDTLQNSGHSVVIQLIFNKEQNQFEGQWYVRTSDYCGEGKFILTFDSTVCEKV